MKLLHRSVQPGGASCFKVVPEEARVSLSRPGSAPSLGGRLRRPLRGRRRSSWAAKSRRCFGGSDLLRSRRRPTAGRGPVAPLQPDRAPRGPRSSSRPRALAAPFRAAIPLSGADRVTLRCSSRAPLPRPPPRSQGTRCRPPPSARSARTPEARCAAPALFLPTPRPAPAPAARLTCHMHPRPHPPNPRRPRRRGLRARQGEAVRRRRDGGLRRNSRGAPGEGAEPH